jgi:GWxTD domain-containing protein
MRPKLYIAVALLFLSIAGISQIKRPEAYLSYASFNTPAGQSYIETYLTVKGSTVRFGKVADSGYQCKVKISVLFKKGDSIKLADSYNLLSKTTADTLTFLDFIGERRYWLPKGEYTVLLRIEDKNNPLAGSVSVNTKVSVGSSTQNIDVSDAEMIVSYSPTAQAGAFTKSGYEMVPYVYNFYPQNINNLNFYVEVYNTMKVFQGSKFAVHYFIESAETKTPVNGFSHTAVYVPDSVIPILGGFGIEKLSSGKYNLVVSVVDKNNTSIISREFSFYRSNAIANEYSKKEGITNIEGTFVAHIRPKDTLLEDVKELYPIANIDERNFINNIEVWANDTVLLRQFLYNFWVGRNPANPEQEWKDYKKQVDAVNKTFSTTNRKGYQTDRGRVYLQYGAPSQRDVETINPATYPYEIWEYYKMSDGQTDKKFVFYEPSLATNDFELLNSTARGEIHNRQWQMVLYKQTVGPYNVDQNSMDDPSGEDALDQFSNPH